MTTTRPTTASVSSVNSSASSVTIFSAASSTSARVVYNDSTAVLYLKFGTTASSTDYTVQIPSQGTYTFPQPTFAGRVDGIWASANGAARITSW